MPYTDRQGQILELAAKGQSDKEIARALGLSAHTVRTHLKRLYRGQQLSNRAAAVAAWVSEQHEQKATDATTGEGSEDSGLATARADLPKPLPRKPGRLGALLRLGLLGLLLIGVVTFQPVAGSWSKVILPRSGSSDLPRPSGSGDAGQAITAGLTQANPAGGLAPSSSAQPSPSPPLPIPSQGKTVKTQLGSAQETLINQDRARYGLPPLASNDCLAAVALLNAQRMASQGYVSSGNGIALDQNCRLGAQPAENLGYWNGINDTAVNSLFMANPVERATILGPFKHVGTAWALSPTGVAFIAVEFG